MAVDDPAKFAGLIANHESDIAGHVARARQKIEDAAEYRRQLDLKNYPFAKEQTDQQMREIGARIDHIATVDPNRLLNSRSAGTKLADFIGSIAGGLAAGQVPGGNGVNHYLEQMNKRIDEDIDAQKANIEGERTNLNMKRSLVAEEFARTGNLYQATETVRAATHQAALNMLLTDMQQYDPAGTRAATYAKTVQAVTAGMQAHAEQVAQQTLKNNFENRKADNADAETAIKMGELNLKRAEFGAKQAKGTGPAKELGTYGQVYDSLNDMPAKSQHLAFRLPTKNGKLGGWVMANNEHSRDEAVQLVKLYNAADYDANEMQKISLERNGAKSMAGGLSKNWSTTQEQHYQAVMLDLANTYGMMIHGRAPTAGVLDEIIEQAAPELKSFWQAGDTTALIGKFRDDIDNRTTTGLNAYGSDVRITSDRPKIEKPNENTIEALACRCAGEGRRRLCACERRELRWRAEAALRSPPTEPGARWPKGL